MNEERTCRYESQWARTKHAASVLLLLTVFASHAYSKQKPERGNTGNHVNQDVMQVSWGLERLTEGDNYLDLYWPEWAVSASKTGGAWCEDPRGWLADSEGTNAAWLSMYINRDKWPDVNGILDMTFSTEQDAAVEISLLYSGRDNAEFLYRVRGGEKGEARNRSMEIPFARYPGADGIRIECLMGKAVVNSCTLRTIKSLVPLKKDYTRQVPDKLVLDGVNDIPDPFSGIEPGISFETCFRVKPSEALRASLRGRKKNTSYYIEQFLTLSGNGEIAGTSFRGYLDGTNPDAQGPEMLVYKMTNRWDGICPRGNQMPDGLVTYQTYGVLNRKSKTEKEVARSATFFGTFIMDCTAPEISFLLPPDGAVQNTRKPKVESVFLDALTGVDVSRTTLRIDGADVSPDQSTATNMVYLPEDELSEGQHIVLLTVYDRAGNMTSAQTVFTIGTGVPDSWRIKYFGTTNIWLPDDPDGDGLSNENEYKAGTNPKTPDFDNDSLPDGWEVKYSLDPLKNDADGDPDKDGLSNIEEFKLDCNPLDPADALRLLEETRANLITHWYMVMDEKLEFNHKPGSPEDKEDIRRALNRLSGKFYKEERNAE